MTTSQLPNHAPRADSRPSQAPLMHTPMAHTSASACAYKDVTAIPTRLISRKPPTHNTNTETSVTAATASNNRQRQNEGG